MTPKNNTPDSESAPSDLEREEPQQSPPKDSKSDPQKGEQNQDLTGKIKMKKKRNLKRKTPMIKIKAKTINLIKRMDLMRVKARNRLQPMAKLEK